MNGHNKHNEYCTHPLHASELSSSPFTQFERWFHLASKLGSNNSFDIEAFSLSTVDTQSQPHSRIVLLKQFSEKGLVFFTNYDSKKGQDLAKNPSACALFWWSSTVQQIRIEGKITKIHSQESDDYFYQRPKESQIAACISPQSQPIQSRGDLIEKYNALLNDSSQSITRPAHWGGYQLQPHRFEFWQGGQHRLHDPFEYYLKNNQWVHQRLAP